MRKNAPQGINSGFFSKTIILLGGFVLLGLLLNIVLRFTAVSIWDDAYFFARYADNWLASNSFSWNLGASPSYGLTSLSYGIWITFLRFFGGEIPMTLWVGSLFWGIVTLVLLSKLVAKLGSAIPDGKKKPALLLVFALTLSAVKLSIHFCSGMDTTMAMAWMSGYLLLYLSTENRLSPSKALLLGLLGGLGWIIRPDLLVFPFLMAFARLIFDNRPGIRKMSAYVLLFTAATVILLMANCLNTLGGLLPLSFYVKSYASYGAGIEAAYAWQGTNHVVIFLLLSIPLWLPIILHFPKDWRNRFPIGDIGLILGVMIFLAYHAFWVTPIMGYEERFLYPAWPVLVFLGARAVNRQSKWPIFEQLSSFTEKRRLNALALGFILLCMGAFSWYAKPANLRQHWGEMKVESAYQELGQNNWPFLPQFIPLGSDLAFASTELGILGALAPQHKVIDLSGLHDPSITGTTFDPDRLCDDQKPDLIYMPHPDYVEMIAALRSSPSFQKNYQEYPSETLHTWLGIAIRKESRYFVQMRDIILEGISVEEESSLSK